ncbi:putative ABC transport system substrate-binding protein [Mycoplana sp. BE70]|uniref:ABC transporter substrate-binding protein n=1 Tax=Mycoplana sp. BE70 TaxID=2817775 RepID=UPI0028616795|nr:ABC transporter substrate-binding protein [Mycoplana sp. BE70]MDR6758778.1 putative ABC transport system substrate-binding protein [Mycoplana sp. BE70]
MNLRLPSLLGSTMSLAIILMSNTAAVTIANAAAPKICVNQYATATVIDDIINGLKEGLGKEGISTESLVIQNPEGDAATQQTLAQGFISDECDVIVAISTPGAQVFRKLTSTIPVVFVGSSTPIEAGLVTSFEQPGFNFTGVADPAPVEADIDAMTKVLPQMKSVGLIYKAGDPAGDFLAKRSIAHMEKRGLTPVIAAIANAGETTQAAQSLIGKVDAIQLPGDSTTMSGIAGIIKVANDAKVPVFGSLSEAVSQGALLSGSYSYVEVGSLAAQTVSKVLAGADPATIPVVVPSAAGFEINVGQAKKLGLEIPAEVMTRATRTY